MSKTKDKPTGPKIGTIRLEIPILEGEVIAYTPSQVQVRLTPQQGDLLRRIYLALNTTDARVGDIRHVDNHPDAIRWMLQKMLETLTESTVQRS